VSNRAADLDALEAVLTERCRQLERQRTPLQVYTRRWWPRWRRPRKPH
jgi:hypothetical protein